MKRRSLAGRANRLNRVLRLPWKKSPPQEETSEANNQERDERIPTDFKGPLGLTLLHDPPEPAKVDFIFVHGLAGGSRKTWSLTEDSQDYWPKEWLSKDSDFKRTVRVHSFGYAADWYEWKKSSLNILDFSRSLLGDISCNPGIRKNKTNIVLIGHSMGGLVIKKTYMLAREDPDFMELASRIHTLYFLATPHRGSDFAKILKNLLNVSYGEKPFVAELNRDSTSIAWINDSFRHVAKDVQIWSFYETNPCNLVFMQAIIVDKFSATLGLPNEKSYPLNADHRGICKFKDESDSNYQTLRNSFNTTVERILLENSKSSFLTLKLQQEFLFELTGISEPPNDDLTTLEDIWLPGSCEWLIAKEIYKSWQDAHSGSRPFFWLSGNAGVGKSVLISRIIMDLQQKQPGCSFFFFKDGISDKSTVVGCLRALAYQIAQADNSVLLRLLEFQQNSPSSEKWDARTIWRKIFLGCIFKDSDPKPHFWVIDAMDECQRYPIFLSLLSSAPPNLRILFTSRNSLEVEKQLSPISNLVEHYQLEEQDTAGDFTRFIESRVEYMPTGYGEGRQKLTERILQKASGSFLWLTLVIQRLEETYSEEEAEEVLSEVPTNMNDVYAKMLEKVVQNPRALVLAKSIYMWTSLSLRPLQIDELQFALKLDTHQTVHSLERFIPSISGQLLFVNRKHEAEVIHQTAKAYLFDQNSHPELVLDKLQCHTRITHVCLTVLTEHLTQGQRIQGFKRLIVSSTSTTISKFTDYACEYFSDHLKESSPENYENWDLLCKFLNSHVLVWIEYLAKKRNLRSVTRTAKNLQAYLRRRDRHLSPVMPQKTIIESWIYDFLKLSAKFSTNLTISPTAIQDLVPAMCPPESLVFKTYASRSLQTGFRIKGIKQRTWDECLVRIGYSKHRPCAVACGDQFSAVALTSGTIHVYLQESGQAKFSMSHGERPSILAFSNDDRYLASGGRRKVRVWDPAEGKQLWACNMVHESLSFLFAEDENVLIAATEGNHVIYWDVRDGSETSRWQWTDSLEGTTNEQRPWQPAHRAAFSPTHGTLAVSYRGFSLYLFDTVTQKFIGCCSRERDSGSTQGTNHYIVDALAFNPKLEVNLLVVSYGDGELAIYDVHSTQLTYRSSNVFAHSLACSSDGRTLVTGSSRGTLRIFGFTGADKDRLSPLYRINTYEDGIRGVAFASNSLRFADIRISEYRIWEPYVLVYNGPDEGCEIEPSNEVTLETTSAGVLGGPPDPEISAMCYVPSGNFVFCGKRDGSVSYFETSTASQKEILYGHAANVGITCIEYIAIEQLLVTADEAGRALINKIEVSKENCRFLAIIADIDCRMSLRKIVSSPSGTMLLLIGMDAAEVWTTEGVKVGSMILSTYGEEVIFAIHPLYPDYFVAMSHSDIRIFSWTDAKETSNLSITSTQNDDSSPEDPSNSDAEQWSPPFLAFFFRHRYASTASDSAVLQIWPASGVVTSSPPPPFLPLYGFANHIHRIRQLIGVTKSVIFFLDVDLWICSLDISTASSITKGAKRHFFLLPEWQCNNGSFIIEYVPATHEFLVVKKHELLVISRGLKFEEPWIQEPDIS